MTHPLYIAFVWHMHQPYYRDLASGECSMPWVRLHGTKDYLDMVTILERFPTLHQTVNLVPSLIDQLEEYLPPDNQSDQYLELSRKSASELTEQDKRFILEWFFMANWDHMVKPYPRYHDLLAKRGTLLDEQAWPDILKRFKPQDYRDLVVWFNLTWIDPGLRQQDPELTRLEAKGSQFTEAEKHLVLQKQLDVLKAVVPAYRAAQEQGRVELTSSPYYHPIMPLLCDVRAAHAALPHLALPEVSFRHPEDARWHLTRALERHEGLFGRRPSGMWPPEGSVSEELVRLAIEAKLRWIATDEEILWRTLKKSRSPSLLYRPHLVRRKHGELAVVFRDRELSDLIGFVYSQWKASIAIQDFLKRLEGIHQQFRTVKIPALVSVILDGENAWEFYPRDGHEFLEGLYEALSRDDRFRLVTVSEFLDQFPPDQSASLPELFAGSWIDGNFATWVGHPEKNTAWAHLAKAREDLAADHRSLGQGGQAFNQAWRSLYVAEGSDWMWWYGDTHVSAQDEEFDRLFRGHLSNVYRFLGQEIPAVLQVPIKTKLIQPAYEPTAFVSPTIDGLDTTYYEWLYAGRLDLRKGYAAAHRGQQLLQILYYGFDQTRYYFRIDPEVASLNRYPAWRIQLEFPDRNVSITVQRTAPDGVSAFLSRQPSQALPCAFQRVLELAVPKVSLPVKPGEAFQLCVSLYQDTQPLERYPAHGAFRMMVPTAGFEAQLWSV